MPEVAVGLVGGPPLEAPEELEEAAALLEVPRHLQPCLNLLSSQNQLLLLPPTQTCQKPLPPTPPQAKPPARMPTQPHHHPRPKVPRPPSPLVAHHLPFVAHHLHEALLAAH